MSVVRKKVIVRELGGGVHRGYLPATDLDAEGLAELLLPDGRVLPLAFREVKHVAYVRDFNLNDGYDPERMGPRSFASKPRGGGLWVRLRFADEDTLEGLLHVDLGFLDSFVRERGIFIDPPDKRGNTQRLFIPRSALLGFEMLGVAGSASPVRRRTLAEPQGQGALFEPPED